MKVCFAASSGGHIEELSQLKGIIGRDDFVLTEKSNFVAVDWAEKVYYINQINRKEWAFIFKFILLFVKSLNILIKEKPDVVISTGALSTFPICILGKLMRKKIIYIESFARIEGKSLTGKLVYPFADLFIVQWEELLKEYPKAVYGGGIF